MVTAGSIISGAFAILRERPKAFAIWSLTYMIGTISVALVTRPIMAAALNGDEAAMGGLFLRTVPVQLLFLPVMLVLFTASQRAVLRPAAEDRFAYLRLGMDELRTFLLALILLVLVYAAMMVVSVAVTALVAGAAIGAGAGSAVAIAFILIPLLLGFIIWLEVRLSLAFPLTLLRRKIVIGESWRLTRGHFWQLFAAYLAIFVIVLLISILASALTAGSYWLELLRGGFNPQSMQEAGQAQLARQFGEIGVMTVLGWIDGGISGALMIALGAGAIATAARGLAVDMDAFAETFA